MTIMAVGAGDLVHIVVVAVPAKPGVGLMAIHAEVVLHVDRRAAALAKYRAWRRPLLATPYAAGVVTRRTVAGLTLQLAMTERTIRVGGYGMSAAKQRERDLIVMAGETGICSLTTVVSFLAASRAGSQGR